MKKFTWILFLLLAANIYGQTNNQKAEWEKEIFSDERLSAAEYKNNILKYDFAPLWTSTVNTVVLGFIGDDYQRLRIKIISVIKDKNNPDTYFVTGKSMVKNSINRFSGTIKIAKARILKKDSWGVNDDYQGQGIKNVGIAFADYNFAEDKTQQGSGVFEGTMLTYWLIDKNDKLRYDDVEAEADGYSNNQFVGTWKSYKTGAVKIANWGDDRIPMSGGLDTGAGEFYPDEKYWKSGWQNYIDAYFKNNKKAVSEEQRQWWK
ncbi:MAG TPA: hypothetical protein VGC76_09695 [Pyrinomonadaceae bacterium]